MAEKEFIDSFWDKYKFYGLMVVLKNSKKKKGAKSEQITDYIAQEYFDRYNQITNEVKKEKESMTHDEKVDLMTNTLKEWYNG